MELTVNSFSKGLQIDSHPMVLGNDSLSDALNATFITQNGNEIILQNDMGNRRIDNAFLPAGYLPVGIKEYGGIIYIAAYNPITNKSQIGSFPSPERKISTVDSDELGGNLEETIFNNESNIKDGGGDLRNLPCLISDTFLVPLTGKVALHTGDKFVVYAKDVNFYSDNSTFNKDTISNCFNTDKETDKEKVISPKNKLYTLKLGILNTQNEFTDITNSLSRWDKNGNLIDETDKSDIYKFNDGYFIRCGSDSEELYKETINDANFIAERRNKMIADTYVYKLVGPLYLQAELNHFLNFDYSYTGRYYNEFLRIEDGNKIYSSEKTLELDITTTIEYNCPDPLGVRSGNSDNDYIYLGDGQITDENKLSNFFYDFFKVIEKENDLYEFIKANREYIITNNGENPEVIYSKENNIYKITFTKRFIFDSILNLNFKYIIAVKSGLESSSNKPIYLQGLSDFGELDLGLFGSGEIKLNKWKFSNDTNQTTLTYEIKAYPQEGQVFSNFKVIFSPQGGNSNTEITLQGLSPGRHTITFPWTKGKYLNNNLEPRTIYKAVITCDDSLSNNSKTIGEAFLLTTKLFNSCYNTINNYMCPDGISSIRDIWNEEHTGDLVKKIRELLKVTPTFNAPNYIQNDSEPTTTVNGSFLSNNSNSNTVESVSEKNFERVINSQLTINEEYYPSYITYNSTAIPQIIPGSVVGIVEDSKENIIWDSLRNNNDKRFLLKSLTINSGILKGTFVWKDIFTGIRTKYNKDLSNVFDTVENYLHDRFTNTNNSNSIVSHSDLILDCNKTTYRHGVVLIQNWNTPVFENSALNDKINNKNKLILVDRENNVYKFDTSDDLYNDVKRDFHLSNFDHGGSPFEFKYVNSDKVFMFLFVKENTKNGGNIKHRLYNGETKNEKYERIGKSRVIKNTKNSYKKAAPIYCELINTGDKNNDVLKMDTGNPEAFPKYSVDREHNCRLYWRNENEGWSIVDKIILINNDYSSNILNLVLNQIKSILFKNKTNKLYFLRYENISANSELNKFLILTNIENTEEYSNYKYKVSFKIAFKGEKGSIEINNTNNLNELLKFTSDINNNATFNIELDICPIESNHDLFLQLGELDDLALSFVTTSGEIILNGSPECVYERNDDGTFKQIEEYVGKEGHIRCIYKEGKLTDYPIDFCLEVGDDKDSWTWFYYDVDYIPIYKP